MQNLASSPCCRGRRDRRHPQSLGHRTGTRRVEQRLRSRAGLRCDEPERPLARSPAAATSAGNAGIAGRRDRSCFISLCPESRDVLNRGPTNFSIASITALSRTAIVSTSVRTHPIVEVLALGFIAYAAFTDAYPERAATTISPARPKKYSRRDVSRSEILGA